jgi:hypothetical protein
MYLEKCCKPMPDSTQRRGFGAVDLFKDREQPPLLMVIVEYKLGDVHGSPIPAESHNQSYQADQSFNTIQSCAPMSPTGFRMPTQQLGETSEDVDYLPIPPVPRIATAWPRWVKRQMGSGNGGADEVPNAEGDGGG